MSAKELPPPVVEHDANRVLVVWTAPWAGPCKSFESITVSKLRTRHPALRIELVSIDDHAVAAKSLDVRGVPWSMLFDASAAAFADGFKPEKLSRNPPMGFLGEFIGTRTVEGMEAFFAVPANPPTP